MASRLESLYMSRMMDCDKVEGYLTEVSALLALGAGGGEAEGEEVKVRVLTVETGVFVDGGDGE